MSDIEASLLTLCGYTQKFVSTTNEWNPQWAIELLRKFKLPLAYD
jgi:hypothetical protein